MADRGDDGRGDPGSPKLMRTPAPYPDESLMGYIVRLTEANGYDTPAWIFDLAGLKIGAGKSWGSAFYRTDFDPTPLEQVIGLKRPEFDSLRYGSELSKRQNIPIDQSISKDFIKFSVPKVCPACLRQANYCRCFWDLLPVTACPAHGLILVDTCAGCGKRVSWVRKNVSFCHCGFDWRSSQSGAVNPVELEASRQLFNLYLPSERCTQGTSINLPSSLGLNDLCRALTLLASYYLFVKEGRRVTTKTNNLLCHEAYSHAYTALKGWPMNFYEFLDETKRLGGRFIRDSELYSRVVRQCDTPSLRFILIALEDYVEEHEWNVPPLGLIFPPTFSRRFIDKEEACRRLRVNLAGLDVLIERRELDVVPKPGTPGILIDAESITTLRSRLSLLLSLLDVALALGIGLADAEDLIRHGCLKPLSGPTDDGLPEWRFDRQAIVDLIARISAMVVIEKPNPLTNLVSAGAAIHQMKIRGLSAGQFVRAVLEGEIIPQKEHTRYCGLGRFRFAKDSVMAFVRKHQLSKSRRVSSFREAARLLAGMKEQNDKVFTSSSKEDYVLSVCRIVDIARCMRSLRNSN